MVALRASLQRRWLGPTHAGGGPYVGLTPRRPALARGASRRPPPLTRCGKATGAEEAGHLTPPLIATTIKTLTAEESMPAPLWGTFCGVSNGLWVGTSAAYNPYTGDAEPVSLEGKARVLQQGVCVVEERVQGEGRDEVLRRRACSNTDEAFQAALHQAVALQFGGGGAAEGGEGDGTAVGEVEWAVESIERSQEGLVLFEGGTFSAGPTSLGCFSGLELAEEEGGIGWHEEELAEAEAVAAGAAAAAAEGVLEEEEDAEEEGEEGWAEDEVAEAGGPEDRVTTLSEWCLQWGTERRVRLLLTLSTAGGVDGTELDVEVLRVVLCSERWEGLPGTYAPSKAQLQRLTLAEPPGPRLRPEQLAGSWKVFETSCVAVEDVSLETGELALVALYSTREAQQAVSLGGGGPEQGEADGAALWLPHGVALQLRMVPPGEAAAAAADVGLPPAWGEPSKAQQRSARRNGSSGRPGGAAAAAGQRSLASVVSESEDEAQPLPGLAITVAWAPEEGTLVSLARHYSGRGELLRVACTTAIRA